MTRLDRNARILAVSFAAMAGMVDAIGFLASGGFFLSFMSGNSTRFSVGVVEGAPYVGMVSLLLLSFVGGVVAGIHPHHHIHFAVCRACNRKLLITALWTLPRGILHGIGKHAF